MKLEEYKAGEYKQGTGYKAFFRFLTVFLFYKGFLS